MYTDLSVLPQKAIEINYLLKKLQEDSIDTVCLDYQFLDQNIEKQNDIIKPQIPSLKIYTRATLVIENTSSLHQLGQEQIGYDVLAIRPLTEKIFHSVCTQYDNYDVISFDIGNKLPFMLKRNPVYEAIRKGKYFQINYAPLFDDSKRVICMTNIANIIKATNGKNLVVSSNVFDFAYHRTPYDVASLLISLGLNKNMALASMKQNCQKVIESGQHRKFFKGTIQEIQIEKVEKISKRIAKHRQKLRKAKKISQK